MLVLALGGVAIAGGACTATTPGATTTTSGQWLAAGCLDGAGTDGAVAPDLLYSGIANRRGNATFSATVANGVFSISGDGTCSGLAVGAFTIVRAASATAAGTTCDSLGAGATATSMTGSAWTVPADAYACSETITL